MSDGISSKFESHGSTCRSHFVGCDVAFLTCEPQVVEVSLDPRSGGLALTGNYVVNLPPNVGMFADHEVCNTDRRQHIYLASPEFVKLQHGDLLGIETAPSLCTSQIITCSEGLFTSEYDLKTVSVVAEAGSKVVMD